MGATFELRIEWLMKGEELNDWHRKVDPVLIQQYLAACNQRQAHKCQMKLHYRGTYKTIKHEVEVLSVIDHQWQVLMSLENLPKVASLREILKIQGV